MSSDPRSFNAAPRAFYGRRKGHKLRAHQDALVADLLPKLSFGMSSPAPRDLRALFSKHDPEKWVPVFEKGHAQTTDVDAVRLEIGFGGGEHLIEEAAAHPRTGFIGCEPYVNGMAKILKRIELLELPNIRLFAGDAAELLAWMPSQSLKQIDLIHPDPWPKRRHWKRRFVQDSTVAMMARVLDDAGEFRFVCDIDHYVAWTLQHLMRSPDFAWIAERADDWRMPWPGYTMTRYGMKAAREGRKAAYLRFRRVPG